MQTRNRHQVARARPGEAVPLVAAHEVARPDRYCRQHRRIVGAGRQSRHSLDDPLAHAFDRAQQPRLQSQAAAARDDVPGRADTFPEQPGLVIEGSRVTVAAWPAQPQFELPYVAESDLVCRLEPAEPEPMWQPVIVERLDDKAHCGIPDLREIGNPDPGHDTVAGKAGSEAVCEG